MAQRTVYDCDRCGKRGLLEHVPVSTVVDVQYGGPGGREDLHESRELCGACAGTVITELLKGQPMDERGAYMKRLKGSK